MRHRFRMLMSGLVIVLTSSLLVLAGSGTASAADRDCADFDSQRAAQLFFLRNGGPEDDPHRLDADGDGIACESNPAPRYERRTLPGGGVTPRPKPRPLPVVRSSVRFRAPARDVVAGERVRMRARVLPAMGRRVVLQRWTWNGWKRVDAARTNNRGRLVVTVRARAATTTYRAVAPRVRTAKRRYTAARSPKDTVTTVSQSVTLDVPRRTELATAVTAVVSASPARFGRTVVLLRRRSGVAAWTVVDVAAQTRGGRARFAIGARSLGEFELRAVVKPHRGAGAVRSSLETLEVVDTTPPAAPTGVTAAADDGSVRLTWDAVAGAAGYVVRVSGGTDGSFPVTGTTYTVTGLVNGQEYAFAVVAVDAAGNVSVPSATATATPTAPEPDPGEPTTPDPVAVP
jgi:hypothetical protein